MGQKVSYGSAPVSLDPKLSRRVFLVFELDVEFSRACRFVYARGLIVNDIHEPFWQCLPGWLSVCQSHIGGPR